jgi:hypothetical protein
MFREMRCWMQSSSWFLPQNLFRYNAPKAFEQSILEISDDRLNRLKLEHEPMRVHTAGHFRWWSLINHTSTEHDDAN